MRVFRFIVILALPPACAGAVCAHSLLETHVEHHTRLLVGSENIDVELELLFFSGSSLVERRKIDADIDGVLGEEEIEAYLAEVATLAEKALGLLVDGEPLELVPLDEPRVESLRGARVRPAPHRLRLRYFARTPAGLGAGSEIRLEEKLFLQAPAICSSEAHGHEGLRLIVEQDARSSRVFRARCLSRGERRPPPGSGPPGIRLHPVLTILLAAGALALLGLPHLRYRQ